MVQPRTPKGPMLLAPGASAHGAYAPAKGQPLPAVDERIVAPEAHAEIVDGRLYRTMGANPPHATQHCEAARVFAGVLTEGYVAAVDMLTRADEDSDAAPDVSVFPSAPDPTTGARQLEEIAFEVLDTERLSHTTKKAAKFAKRGVRRLFAVRLSNRAVYEWDHAHGDWTELDAAGEIVDRCFRVPLPVAALVDRVLADDTVARGLLASRNRVIEGELAAREVRGEARGKLAGSAEGRRVGQAEGLRMAIVATLEARGVALGDGDRARIEAEARTEVLQRWVVHAVRAASVAEVFEG